MVVYRVFSSIILSTIIALFALPVHANEPVIFNENYSAYTEVLINNILEDTDNKKEIAIIDLNKDNASEYIVRSKNCPPNTLCEHTILAHTNDTMTLLGRITAKKITLSDQYTYGVRDLMVFSNQKNDFNFTIYSWDPQHSRYRLKTNRVEAS